MTYSAILANSYFGEWEIYIITEGHSDDWPLHSFGRTAPTPTLAERTAALAGLGYQAVDGAAWEWIEMDNNDTDAVEFRGSFEVRPTGEAL
ncbi:DUF6303 family protein [Streptomyces erythrochromogenes]|uniref:DUF6303 family protein n=1 Tax=Streptomyces erythrochromogenes TaxID=285574 RepID=UPI00068D549F|nr:DUF6303 family protein [Streptomyces erythrochromogenes]